MIGNPQLDDRLNAGLVGACGLAVVSVDYRLVPRVPLADAMDDCLAAARWLGVGLRRLAGTPAAALERDTQALVGALTLAIDAPLRLRRVAVAFPGSEVLRFADLWLAPRDAGGYWLEAHAVDEFPGDDPAQLLPSALSA